MIPLSRRAGITVPLFSLRSTRSWGIGEIGDIPAFAEWLRAGNQSVMQILPLNELAPSESSPYSALSAMAIDPQFISIWMMDEAEAFEREWRFEIERVRQTSKVDYKAVRDLKGRVLRTSFERFIKDEWVLDTGRAAAFRAFIEEESWWLDEYSVYRALRADAGERPWPEWPAELRDSRALCGCARSRTPCEPDPFLSIPPMGRVAAVADHPAANRGDRNRRRFSVHGDARQRRRVEPPAGLSPRRIGWHAARRIQRNRPGMGTAAIQLGPQRAGTISSGSACARDDSPICTTGFASITSLASIEPTFGRSTGVRLSSCHLEEPAQVELGETVMRIMIDTDADVSVEDLGTVPEFVRESIARLGLPGYKVLRWEPADPMLYPPLSVAMTGTHDTEPLAVWWDSLTPKERIRFGSESPVSTPRSATPSSRGFTTQARISC